MDLDVSMCVKGVKSHVRIVYYSSGNDQNDYAFTYILIMQAE